MISDFNPSDTNHETSAEASSTRCLDLAMVLPVYNEQDCIDGVIEEWIAALVALDIRFQIIVLNDGSKDGTASALRPFESHPQIKIINKTNSGHGPTILRGYREAVEIANWVFQCDSDNEIRASDFAPFWEKRAHYDALFGVRQQRISDLSRKVLSTCSRWTIMALFGKGVDDVNVPFRLMRADLLKPMLRRIPATTFAPNIVIAGAFARSGARIANLPVTHYERQTGEVSIQKAKLLRIALLSFTQTLRLRRIGKKRS